MYFFFFSIYKVLQTIALVIHVVIKGMKINKGGGPGSKLAELKLMNAAAV